MAVNKKFMRMFVKTIIVIFLIVCCSIGMLFWMFHFAPEKFFGCYEFGLNTYACAKYYLDPYPPNKWVYCERIEDIRKYLENEKVQKIVFCGISADDDDSPDKLWTWGEVTEPERINKTLQLIRDGKVKGIITVLCFERMKIITDKHKFIMPVAWDAKEVFSHRWRSPELRKQLRNWGFDNSNDANVPAKED